MGNIHRARCWELAAFACNQTAVNLYVFFMGFVSYYVNGLLGAAVIFAGTFPTVMRIWDAVTDPLAGHYLDHLRVKAGKYRSFILAGNLGMLASTWLMFRCADIPQAFFRLPAFTAIYMMYVIFMTAQSTAGRAGLALLTNDPVQRAAYGAVSGIAIRSVYSFVPIFFYGTLMTRYGGFTGEFFSAAWKFTAPFSLLFSLIAAAGIARSDRAEFMIQNRLRKRRFSLCQFVDVIRGNRAMQMLVISACTDKLSSMVQSNATASVLLYGIVCGNLTLSGRMAAYTGVPCMAFVIFGCGLVASRFGQTGAMKAASWGGLVVSVLLMCLSALGDMRQLSLPGIACFEGWNLFSLAFLILYVLMKGFTSVTSGVVPPMIADISDYETYRTGDFVPGVISSTFNFVDKFISAFGTTLVAGLCAAAGYTRSLPDASTPYSTSLHAIAVFCMFGTTALGLICNLIAMRYYPLTPEKMKEIQAEIARIKEHQGVKI